MNYFTSIDNTFKKHRIRPTRVRKEILKLFIKTDYAISHADIVKEMSHQFDRVTIYRALNLFVDNGLIHKIMDDSGVAKFACLLSEHNSISEDSGEHLHFKCLNCGHIYCLNSIDRHDLDLPKNYQLHTLTLTAKGICKACKSQKEIGS